MEPRRAPEYQLEITADRPNVKDVVKGKQTFPSAHPHHLTDSPSGVLHTIFFHRYFTPLYPATHDILDITLPYVTDDEIETLVEQRATSLVRQLDIANNQQSTQYSHKGGKGQIVIQFLEKKRRKGGWFGTKADEETVWETWVVDVTLATSRNESGRNVHKSCEVELDETDNVTQMLRRRDARWNARCRRVQ